jgi:hypothetical protein
LENLFENIDKQIINFKLIYYLLNVLNYIFAVNYKILKLKDVELYFAANYKILKLFIFYYHFRCEICFEILINNK